MARSASDVVHADLEGELKCVGGVASGAVRVDGTPNFVEYMVGDTPMLMRAMARGKQADDTPKSVRWEKPGEAVDALLTD